MVADVFLLYVAPRRADYRLFVEAPTPDFQPDSPYEQRVLATVLAEKRRKRGILMGISAEHSRDLEHRWRDAHHGKEQLPLDRTSEAITAHEHFSSTFDAGHVVRTIALVCVLVVSVH